MFRTGVISALLVFLAGVTFAADPPAAPKVPKDLLEKRVEAARKVYEQNLTRIQAGQANPAELFGWSEKWASAELALVKTQDEKAKILRAHLDRTRAVERLLVSAAKAGQARQVDADAATYYRLQAEILLHKEGVEPQAEKQGKKPETKNPEKK